MSSPDRGALLVRGAPLFVLSSLVAAALAFAGEEPASPLGVVDKELFDDAAEVGSGWMREHIVWKYFETTDGVFSPGGYDFDLSNMESRGIRMSPVLVTGLGWATHQAGDAWDPGDDPDSYPDAPSRAPNDLSSTYDATHAYSATYYDFVYTFVQTFGDRIDRITIENEVNAANFWEDSAEEYLRLLVTARKAARDANPSVMVFDSGMGSGSWGVAIAESRYDAGTWAWNVALNFIRDYYERDVYVRSGFPQIYTISTPAGLEAFFDNAAVVENNHRVGTVLTGLYSAELGDMLVDGLNFKFTGEPWHLGEVISWIDEMIASVPQQSPVDVKVNNEASNWCRDFSDFDAGNNVCATMPGDERPSASEMVQKIMRGFEVGVDQNLWFPFSNCLPGNCPIGNEPTPRLGLIDYEGNRTESFDAFQRLARFVGPSRVFDASDEAGDVVRVGFREVVTDRVDVHVLWWDNGGHGAGTADAVLAAPLGTVVARQYTADGDSLELVVDGGEVTASVTEAPSIVYFDDGVTPIQWPLDPVVGPVPPAVRLSAPAPNPAPGWTRVRFGLPAGGTPARVAVYDVAGRELAVLVDGTLDGGTYTVRWDGRDRDGRVVAEGVYVVRLTTPSGGEVRKLVLAR